MFYYDVVRLRSIVFSYGQTDFPGAKNFSNILFTQKGIFVEEPKDILIEEPKVAFIEETKSTFIGEPKDIFTGEPESILAKKRKGSWSRNQRVS